MIEVFDNFAPKDYFELIQNHILSWNQEWYYQTNITGDVFGKDGLGKHGFMCHIIRDSKVVPTYGAGLLAKLLTDMKISIGCKNILRSRLDMTIYTPGGMRCDPHVDSPDPHVSTIFYINDSDGPTVIFKEKFDGSFKIDQSNLTVQKEIKPKANRLLVFDGHYIHTGHVPAHHNNRVILNSNFN
tara:strand:- start:70 stop:624 length:555 start_codon:yes stop_codon:yes gene_type:complete